jgi:hypothetical protein
MANSDLPDGYIFLDTTGEKLELLSITAAWDQLPDTTY